MSPRSKVVEQEWQYADWRDRLEDRIGGVEFRFAPMPWDWRLRWSKDELTPFWWIEVGPFAVLLSLNFIGWRPPLSGPSGRHLEQDS